MTIYLASNLTPHNSCILCYCFWNCSAAVILARNIPQPFLLYQLDILFPVFFWNLEMDELDFFLDFFWERRSGKSKGKGITVQPIWRVKAQRWKCSGGPNQEIMHVQREMQMDDWTCVRESIDLWVGYEKCIWHIISVSHGCAVIVYPTLLSAGIHFITPCARDHFLTLPTGIPSFLCWKCVG